MTQKQEIQDDLIQYSKKIGVRPDEPFFSILSTLFQLWILGGQKIPIDNCEIRFINQYIYDYLSKKYETLPKVMRLVDVSYTSFYVYVMDKTESEIQNYEYVDEYEDEPFGRTMEYDGEITQREYRIPACLLWWDGA